MAYIHRDWYHAVNHRGGALMRRLSDDGNVLGLLVGILVLVILAGALIPTIFDSSSEMVLTNETHFGNETYWDGTNHLDLGPTVTLIDIWPMLVVIGVMLIIIGVAL